MLFNEHIETSKFSMRYQIDEDQVLLITRGNKSPSVWLTMASLLPLDVFSYCG